MEFEPTQASLFSAAGFGDMGFRDAGLQHLLLCDIEPKRSQLAARNFPEASFKVADLSTDAESIAQSIEGILTDKGQERLFLLSATPPCQGMSKNGIGSLIRAKEDGKRPKVDKRNQLYKPFLGIAEKLLPNWIFFENVCRMKNTFALDESGSKQPMCTIMENYLHSLGYSGIFRQLQLADYGLPQTRLRMVGIFRHGETYSKDTSWHPPPTHSNAPTNRMKKWVSLREAIGEFPAFNASPNGQAVSDFHPLHRVPRWRPELARWLEVTPEGRSAFENDHCPKCGHENERKDLFCVKCDEQLPKPAVSKNGKLRIIRGFTSAYKRMYWDKPGSTVTTRSAYACSDHKVHPSQDRVLSTFEVATLQGIDVNRYNWARDEEECVADDTLLRDIIGECVPPLFAEIVGRHIIEIEAGTVEVQPHQQLLFR